MFCAQCGNKLNDGDGFCAMCGAPRPDETQFQVPDALPQHEEAHREPVGDAPSSQPEASPTAETPAPAQVPQEPAPEPPRQNAEVSSPASKPNRKAIYIAAAILAVAIAVVAVVVLGGGNAGDPDNATSAGDANAASASAPAAQADDDASSSESAEEERSAEEESSDRIQADGFSFELPEYWKGKVVGGKIEGGVALYPDTALGCVEGYELVKLTLVPDDGPGPGGDYVTHSAGIVRGDGMRVQVVSKKWAAFYGGDWYRHPNYAGSSQEQELAAALIDLSSGGAYSYDDVRTVAENATNDADAYSPFLSVDVDFLNETLIPTVKIDGSDNASDGDSNTSNLSEEDYENIALSFALQMFTTADNTDDGGMKWIGCDPALQLVRDGSPAEACDYWDDTTSHVYLRETTDVSATKIGDPHHYQVQVTYESALDATGVNRQANIATVEVWLDDQGYVEDLEVISLS